MCQKSTDGPSHISEIKNSLIASWVFSFMINAAATYCPLQSVFALVKCNAR